MSSALLMALSITPYADVPPEWVCQHMYYAVREHRCQLERIHEVGGGWRLQSEIERVKRVEQMYWAGWWVTWPRATDAQRACWGRVYYDRLAEIQQE